MKQRFPSNDFDTKSQWMNSMSLAGRSIIDMWECSSVLLFHLLIWLASMSIQVIIEEVKNPFPPIYDTICSQAVKWKRSYFSIFKFINQVNQFFGFFLLFFIVKQLVAIFLLICNALFCLTALSIHGTKALTFHYFISCFSRNFLLMALVLIPPQNMEQKVIKI